MTHTAAASQAGTSRWRPFLLAGVVVLGAGVAVATLGVAVAPLFVPGTWIIALGFLLLAGSGILGVIEGRARS